MTWDLSVFQNFITNLKETTQQSARTDDELGADMWGRAVSEDVQREQPTTGRCWWSRPKSSPRRDDDYEVGPRAAQTESLALFLNVFVKIWKISKIQKIQKPGRIEFVSAVDGNPRVWGHLDEVEKVLALRMGQFGPTWGCYCQNPRKIKKFKNYNTWYN